MAAISTRKLLGVYRECISATEQFLNKSSFAVKFADINTKNLNGKECIVIELIEPLHFKNWPYRIGSRKRVDILAEIVETIRMSDGKCVHSTLRINYFRPDGDRRIASDAVHYDFSDNIQHQHPICHAQSMNKIPDRRPDGFPENIDVASIENRNQSVRIPTAFVNLAGLFVKLTADHLPPKTYTEFWSECKSYIDKIPNHASNEVFDQIFDARSLHSYSWYKRRAIGQ